MGVGASTESWIQGLVCDGSCFLPLLHPCALSSEPCAQAKKSSARARETLIMQQEPICFSCATTVLVESNLTGMNANKERNIH